MKCPVMIQLIKKLDTVTAEQCNARGNEDDAGKKERLRAIEALLDYHEQTCSTCRQLNPHGTGFVELSSRAKF
jgi:hypothetical protein